MKNQPRFINKFLKNGKYKFFKSGWSVKWVNINIPKTAIIIWIIILNLNETPEELLN